MHVLQALARYAASAADVQAGELPTSTRGSMIMVDCEAVTRDISTTVRTLSKAAVDKVSSALLR
jgi:hypothetical protein